VTASPAGPVTGIPVRPAGTELPDRLNCASSCWPPPPGRAATGHACAPRTETWTYGETVRQASDLAQVLTDDFSLQPGSRVLLLGPSNPWLAAAWLAVIKADEVAVTIMALLRKAHRPSECSRGADCDYA
jgi:2-aminobenzoate-CoA ligase